MFTIRSANIQNLLGRGLLIAAIQVGFLNVSMAAPSPASNDGLKTTTMAAQTAADISKQIQADLQKNLRLNAIYFATISGEFNEYCRYLNAGPECQKWPSLRAQGLRAHFAPLFNGLPAAPRDRLEALVKNKASVATLRMKYFEEMKNYLKSYAAMTKDVNRIFEPIFLRYGVFVPDHAASKELKVLIQKYAYAGVELKDFDDTVTNLISLRLKQLITVMYYSSPADKEGLNLSNPAINSITRDPVTKEILSKAHAFFKSEQGGLFSKGEIEKAAIARLYLKLAEKAPLSHGVWTKNKKAGSIENLPSTVSLAKQGKVLNAHTIVKLWETVKGFNSEFLSRILLDNKDARIDQLVEHPEILRLGNPSDIGRAIDLVFFQPVVSSLQKDIYQMAYYQEFLSQLDDPRVDYQFRDFLKESRGRFTNNVNAIEKLEKQFPGIIDRKRFDATAPKRKGADQAKADIKAAKENSSEPSGTSQIAEGGRKLWQWMKNTKDFVAGTVVDTYKRQPRGTYSSLRVMKRHEEMLRTYGYSAFGTNTEFIKGSKLGFIANQTILAPILSVSGMIGGTMVLLEDGWDSSIQNVYGMSEEQYNRAEKTDAGIKALKVGFYVIQGSAGLLITVGTGGAAAPAFATRAAVAGLTLRTAASILIKPTFRAGVMIARRSVQPLTMAFGLGAVFSVSQELYESEKPGGKFDWNRVASGTSRGASTTLMFMGGMTMLARKMTAMNFSQAAIIKTSAAIDVLESSGDVPQTFEMWKESKTPLQYAATGLMFIGNILDSGDSAYTILRGTKAESAATDTNQNSQPFVPVSPLERSARRVEVAVTALGEPITPRQADVLRNFLPGTGQSTLEARLLKAKMTPQKARKVAGLYGLWKSEYF